MRAVNQTDGLRSEQSTTFTNYPAETRKTFGQKNNNKKTPEKLIFIWDAFWFIFVYRPKTKIYILSEQMSLYFAYISNFFNRKHTG